MKLSKVAVTALKAATRVALENGGRFETDTYNHIRELYDRACDALENWTYDEASGTWTVKQQE
jgi:hypothetical protein